MLSDRTRREVLRTAGRLAGSLAAVGPAGAQSAAEGTVWPSFGFDTRNNAHGSAPEPTKESTPQWTADVGGAVQSSLTGGGVFVDSDDGSVYAVYALSGERT